MTAKLDLPQIPPALEDVALIDGPSCAAAGGLSISRWHELVRLQLAPQPVIRAPRYTRWRLGEIRTWLSGIQSEPRRSAVVLAKARNASAAAKALKGASTKDERRPPRSPSREGRAEA
jgi:hypothetical protein